MNNEMGKIPNPNSQISRLQATKLLVVVGPTAVGKSAIAIELAERLRGEIISADSRYLYRGLEVGTAKPSPADRARVPHHLIDVADPDQPVSLAEYQEMALTSIKEVYERGRLPLLVGGTGQYIRAVVEGWTIPRRMADATLRAELEAIAKRDGVEALHNRLVEVDPLAASAIDSRNIRRVIRALEVTLTTGQPFSAQRQKKPPDFRAVIVGLTLARSKLFARIDARVEAMIASGLVEETKALAAKGYDWQLPALSAIGYKQIGMYLRGECDLKEAIRLIKHDTRRFVRAQDNWFRRDDPDIHWYDVERLEVEQLAVDVKRYVSITTN
jgi:tRNA dimethylallyltransferase